MLAWTKEQQLAIDLFNKNIIVSAGAGSGKTAVLTERVVSHLKKNIHLNELLLLTFTNAAAKEMKERIRLKIKNDLTLKEELKYLSEAQITTFDSFFLYLVKKYHYLLNLPKNPKITEDALIVLLKKECLDEVFINAYETNDEPILKLINTFCIKDDETLKEELFTIINKLEKKEDVSDYLKNIKAPEFNVVYNEYEKIVKDAKKEFIETVLELKELTDKKYQEKLDLSISELKNANTYEEIYERQSLRLPNLPKNSPEEVKEAKDEVASSLKKLKELLRFKTKEEMQRDYELYKDNIFCLKYLFEKFFLLYEQKRKENGYYDFDTISHLALKLLKDNETVLDEVKSSFKEILVDEYQDTNDIQESFLSLIENNNVYMVGDIKQSIYGFRNANPKHFKKKYDAYAKNENGFKIDLLKNFRSRSEVLANINFIFNALMDEEIGGARYLEEHQMIAGNSLYEENKEEDYNMEIYLYQNELKSIYSKEEQEAFWIAKDIKRRMKYSKVLDKQTNKLRLIEFKDICILIDRKTSFPLYEKIFSYLQIPLQVYDEDALTKSIHFTILKNCFIILSKLETKEYDEEFVFALTSISRSFLFFRNDEEIYSIITNKEYYKSSVIEALNKVRTRVKAKNLEQILDEILRVTKYKEKLIKIGDIKESITILKKIKDYASICSNAKMTYLDFASFLDKIEKSKLNISYKKENENIEAVKLMSIHASKGLEFPICYFSGLSKQFNLSELKERFILSETYGLYSNIENDGITDFFVKELIKKETLKEEIAEKIRLFYVALTRAKEKLIFILPQKENKNIRKNDGVFSANVRLKVKSYADILNLYLPLLKPQKIDILDLGLTKDYLKKKSSHSINIEGEILQVNNKELKYLIEEEKRYSKKIVNYLTKEEKTNLDLGTSFHECLQYIDFKTKDLSKINNSFIRQKVSEFLNSKLIKENSDAEIYREYEFFTNESHGIIDLWLKKEDKIILIDYKLKQTDKEEYKKQLQGYVDYLKDLYNIPIYPYLYSLIDGTFTFLEI